MADNTQSVDWQRAEARAWIIGSGTLPCPLSWRVSLWLCRARQAEMRSRETEEMTLRARQRYADELAKTRLERDELKAILLR